MTTEPDSFELVKAEMFIKIPLSNIQSEQNGDSNVSLRDYKMAYSDSVARNIAARFGDQPTVKDFGAIGNGVVDDTAAIQAAIDASTMYLLFPPGVYNVSDTITLDASGLCIQGTRGAIIQSVDGSGAAFPMFSIQEDDVTIKGLTFSGNTSNTAFDNSAVEIAAGSYENLTFKDCTFKDFASYGIHSTASGTLTNIRVINCSFKDFTGTQGCFQTTVGNIDGFIADNCFFQNLTVPGISLVPTGANTIKGVMITASVFDHQSTTATSIGIDVQDCTDLVVSGCNFLSQTTGVSCSGSVGVSLTGNTFNTHTGYSIYIGTANGVSITGNTMTDFATAIRAEEGCNELSISSNIFRNATPGTDGYAIELTPTVGAARYKVVSICNNTLYDCTGFEMAGICTGIITGNAIEASNGIVFSIHMGAVCENVICSNNQITTYDISGTTANALVTFEGSDIIVENNNILCKNGSTSASSAIAAESAGTNSRVIVRSNYVQNFAQGIRLSEGTPTYTNSFATQNFFDSCTASYGTIPSNVLTTMQPTFAVSGPTVDPTPLGTTFRVTTFDTPTILSGFTSFSNGLLTINIDGIYLLTAVHLWSANGIGYRNAYIRYSNGTVISSLTARATNGVTELQTTAIVSLSRGDVIETAAFTSDGSRNLTIPSFTAVMIV